MRLPGCSQHAWNDSAYAPHRSSLVESLYNVFRALPSRAWRCMYRRYISTTIAACLRSAWRALYHETTCRGRVFAAAFAAMSAAASEEDDVVILPTQPHELIDLTDSPEPAGGENCTNSAARKRPADAIPISDGDRAGDDTPPPASRELIFKSPKKEKKGLKEEELGGGAAVQNAAPPASDLQDRLLRHFANSTHTWTAGELAVTLDAPWRDVGCALSRLALSHGLVSADAGGERAWSAPPSGIKLEPGVKKQAASGVKVEAAAAGAAGPAALAAAAAFAAAAAAAAAPQAAPAALGRRERKAKFKSSVSRPVVQLAELPQSQHSSTPLLLGSGLYARFVPGLQPQVPQLQLMNAAAEALLRPSTGQLANVGWLEAPTGTGKSLALLVRLLCAGVHLRLTLSPPLADRLARAPGAHRQPLPCRRRARHLLLHAHAEPAGLVDARVPATGVPSAHHHAGLARALLPAPARTGEGRGSRARVRARDVQGGASLRGQLVDSATLILSPSLARQERNGL